MPLDLNTIFDDPRFAEAVALFGATGPHNAGLLDAAKAMQHTKQLKGQREKDKADAEYRRLQMEQATAQMGWDKEKHVGDLDARSASTAVSRLNAENLSEQNRREAAKRQQEAAFLAGLAKDPRFAKYAPLLGGLGDGSQPAPSSPAGAAPITPQPAVPMQQPMSAPVDPATNFFRSKIIPAESDGKQFNAQGRPLMSPKGAIGRAQVLMSTGPEAAALAGLPWDPERLKNDAEYNEAVGLAYFNKQLADFGDMPSAAAAYNAGPGRLKQAQKMAAQLGNPTAWLAFMPKETQAYVQKTTGYGGGMVPAQLQGRSFAVPQQQGADPFAEQRELQELGGVLSLVNPKYGQAFDMLSKGSAPREIKPGAVYSTPQGQYTQPDPRGDTKRLIDRNKEIRDQAEEQRKRNADAETARLRPTKERQEIADADFKETKAKKEKDEATLEIKNRENAKRSAHGTLDEMEAAFTILEKKGGATKSGAGLFHNLPAAAQSSPMGQAIQRITGTEAQGARNTIEGARSLLLPSMMQAMGMGVRMMDNVKEFEAYQKAIANPQWDLDSNRAALKRMRQILTGEAPMTLKDGTKVSIEKARELFPAEPAQPAAKQDRSSQFKVLR